MNRFAVVAGTRKFISGRKEGSKQYQEKQSSLKEGQT